jgi:N-methylhydantoinase B
VRLTTGTASYSLLSDGAVVPPFGVLGGMAAAPVDSFVVRDGKEIHFATPGKVGGFPMRAGDMVVLQSAGGGGYGDPLERPAEEVAEDIREGYVSAHQGREHYGVLLREDGSLDEAATRALRAEIAEKRVRLQVVPHAAPLYAEGRYSRHRVCPLNPKDAAALGVEAGAIVELVGRAGPALRAWAVIDDNTAAGTVPLDAVAQRVVSAKPGERLHVRPLGKIEVL